MAACSRFFSPNTSNDFLTLNDKGKNANNRIYIDGFTDDDMCASRLWLINSHSGTRFRYTRSGRVFYASLFFLSHCFVCTIFCMPFVMVCFFSLLSFRSYAICMLSCCFWSVVCLAIFIHWYATIIPQTYGERAISPYNSESGGERFYPQFECTGMNVEKWKQTIAAV